MRIQIKGDTLDEAINNAMTELFTTSDNIEYEIIQQGSSGFLGIGAKKFIIEAYKKDDKDEIFKKKSLEKLNNAKPAENADKLVEKGNGVFEFKSSKPTTANVGTKPAPAEKFVKKEEKMLRNPEEVYKRVEAFLTPIFNEFETNIEYKWSANVDTNTVVLNISGEKMGVIIGKHGQTLDAIQHLANIICNNGEENRVKIRIDSENYREKRNQTIESLAKSVANTVRKTHRDYPLEPMSSYERRIIHSVLQKEKNIETVSVGFDEARHVIVKYKK